MAYNKFTLDKVKEQFNLTVDSTLSLFQTVQPVMVSARLTETLAEFTPLAVAINTEKARSELIVAPVLAELRKATSNQISLFSGTTLNVDPKQHLIGVCDFIISRSPDQYVLTAPLVTIVEAKNDNVTKGLGQCIATMIAAQYFNEKKKSPFPAIYGATTSGTEWKFLKLVGQTVYIDAEIYYLRELGKIMGIFLHMLS